MGNQKKQVILIAILFFAVLITIQTSVLGTNDNIEMLKKQSGDYLIYIKDNLNSDFEFAFSNNKDTNKADLVFKDSETDSTGENANKIAFVNSSNISIFDNKTYMWAKEKNTENYILEGIEIDLNEAIHEYDLEVLTNITKNVNTKIEQETTQKEEDGKKITTTVGKVTLPQEYSYILLKAEDSNENQKLFDIATKISKFNQTIDMYTKIKTYKAFAEALDNVERNVDFTKWEKSKNNSIEQPVDAKDGEQYILFLGNEIRGELKIEDVQFLTSTRKESEEKIIEKITTKLPITYDNNTLLIVLLVLIVLSIAVFIRIKVLSKKQEK